MCSRPRIEAGLEGIYWVWRGGPGGTPDLQNKTSVPGVIRIVISKHVWNRGWFRGYILGLEGNGWWYTGYSEQN